MRNTAKSTKKKTDVGADSNRRIRYAVVGLGYIAQAAVLPGFAHASKNSELVALVSGDPQKLTALSKKYKVKRTYNYEQYAACLASGEIDAVYIALPNSMHRAYAQGAALAGVHVLSEKPMAKTVQECEAMIDEAEKAKIKLMIAYRLHFELGNLTSAKIIRDGKIGEPRIFRSAFCQQVTPGNSRLRESTGGGPLYDIGVYCINAARILFRAEPLEVFAYAATGDDKRFAEVQEMCSAVMRFPDNRLAAFTCSFGAADRSTYEVIGTKGVLKMDPAYQMVGDLKCEVTIDGKSKTTKYKKRDQFGPEIEYFSDCILKNMEPEPGGREGLQDVRIINALLDSQESGRPVVVSPIDVGERATLELEMHKLAVESPKLVRAASPSK